MSRNDSLDNNLRDEDLRALGRAAAELSHEIRNLLVGVLAQAELLASGRAADPVETAQRIRAAAISCKELVEDVLRFARHEERPAEGVDLGVIAREAARALPRQRGPAPLVAIAAKPAIVLGNAGALHRLLLNLLKNADEAAPEGGIRLRLERQDDRLRLTVSDDGPGIPAAEAERIFDPFRSSGKEGGTGLGLAIARRIAEDHGGSLALAPDDGPGATFVLEFPAAEETIAAAEETSDEPLHPALRILCIDDDPGTRESYRMILGLEGHQVDCAADATTALRLAREGDYDAIVADLRLPDMRIEALLERLAAIDPELARRVLFATGDLLNESSRRFLDQAGRPWLAKPFRIEELRLALDLVMRT